MKKYEIVEQTLRGEITSRILKPGDKLPDLEQLCERFEVSHITIQKALANLTKAGYLARIKSKGTFVQDNRAKESAGTLAMIISVIERNDTTLLSTIKGAQNEAAQQGFTFLLEITDGYEESERKAIATLAQSNVDGLLLYLNHEKLAYQMLGGQSDMRGKLPYVMLDHYETNRPCSSVTANNTNGGFLATEYLLKQGHSRIAYLYTNLSKNTEFDRYSGYRDAMGAYGLKEDAVCMHEEETAALPELLKRIRAGELTAAFAVNDRVALRTLHYLYESGVRVPDDFSLLGFDDSHEAEFAIVPLTTMRQDFFEVGVGAVKLLKEMLNEAEPAQMYKKVFLPTRLVVRNSVKELNQ